jgi:hypothetical protein
MEVRALWDQVPSPTQTTPLGAGCTPFTLPSNGVLDLGDSTYVTLTADAIFAPSCTTGFDVDVTVATEGSPTISYDFRDPFYASTLPAVYALAASTVVAYMLVIILFITPRTFVSGGMVVLGRRGFTNGASAEAGIGVGRRPWLQKVATLFVAISLSIATANTFSEAKEQYDDGYMDAKSLQERVLKGQELTIIMIISDTFLWLAQAQTLIRLFPRQREKVIIKWTALALISLDLLFSILNNFVFEGQKRPAAFVDAIPALSYLFQLALGLLYCAWVMYYALTKKQYAFYHPRMRNMCLLSFIALISVLVPVVFFVLDISKPNVAGWGDYVRWVGAAAASVVVWEWVERIEALERNEKKDGVLGREVFDGDEMLEVTPSSDAALARRRRRGGDGGEDAGATSGRTGSSWPGLPGSTSRHRNNQARKETSKEPPKTGSNQPIPTSLPLWPTRPAPAATPVSRTDTTSAESTVYAVRYHPLGDASETIPESFENSYPDHPIRASVDIEAQLHPDDSASSLGTSKHSIDSRPSLEDLPPAPEPRAGIWRAFDSIDPRAAIKALPTFNPSALNPFGRNRQKPPLEVSAHTQARCLSTSIPAHKTTQTWDLLGKIEDFTSVQVEMIAKKARPNEEIAANLPVTRIPAPPRRRTIREIQEVIEREEEAMDQSQRQGRSQSREADGAAPAATSPAPSRPLLLSSRSHPTSPAYPSEPVMYRGSLSFAAARSARRRDGFVPSSSL